MAWVTPDVAWITYTPVKGLALLSFDTVELTERGVADDRRFHVIDARGRLTNAKRLGVLQQVKPAWDEASGVLTLTFPDGVVADEVRLGEDHGTAEEASATAGARTASPTHTRPGTATAP